MKSFNLSDLTGLKKPTPAKPPSALPVTLARQAPVAEPAAEGGTGTSLVPVSTKPVASLSSDIFSLKEMEDILVSMGVKPGHVHVALRRAAQTKEPLAQIMRDFGFLSGEGVAVAVSKQTRFTYFSPQDAEAIRRHDLEGLEVLEFKRFVPVGRRSDGTLLLAVPDASVVNDALNAFFSEKTEIVIASEHTIQTVYRKYFANTERALDTAIAQYMEARTLSRRSEEDDTSLGLIRDIYFALIRHACYSGASDLYLSKSEYVGIVRLKINGVGQIFRTIDQELYRRLLTKMVHDSSVKTEDLRVRPREAVVEFSDEDKRQHHDIASRFGFRLELTQSRGEIGAVIRILDKNSAATDLSRLDFDADTLKAIKRVSRAPNGFFLVTGPTGSGKTTTLYAVLKDIDAVERSVQSIENPIEYKHGLWQQYELRKDATNEGDEYNEWLKALLRNAPDVILVGEVRDRNVAGICMDAANTGHLVFATLHTNSAALALARLKALHVDQNLLGSVLLGILAQRLLRTLCDCAVPDTSLEVQEALNEPYLGSALKQARKAGKGCENCGYTGYRGRRMIYELLEMTPAVRDAVETGAGPSMVARLGLTEERTMWANGLKLVASGVTSLEELERVAAKNV